MMMHKAMIKYHHLQIVEFGLRTCALVEETGGGVAGAGVVAGALKRWGAEDQGA